MCLKIDQKILSSSSVYNRLFEEPPPVAESLYIDTSVMAILGATSYNNSSFDCFTVKSA
jgi:hypothetical protein